MGTIIIIVLIILGFKLLTDALAKREIRKIRERNPELLSSSGSGSGKPLPTPSDCREMIVQFFDIVQAVNEKAPYMSNYPHRLNMYGGGTDNMHLHIEYDKDFHGIDNIVRDQLGYDLPRTKPEGGGWYSDGRYLCFDSDHLTGGYEWQCNCMRNEGALTQDFKGLIESYFPNMKYKSFKCEYLVDYLSFLAIGEG